MRTSATLLNGVCIGVSFIGDQIRKHQHTRRDYADSGGSPAAPSRSSRPWSGSGSWTSTTNRAWSQSGLSAPAVYVPRPGADQSWPPTSRTASRLSRRRDPDPRRPAVGPRSRPGTAPFSYRRGVHHRPHLAQRHHHILAIQRWSSLPRRRRPPRAERLTQRLARA